MKNILMIFFLLTSLGTYAQQGLTSENKKAQKLYDEASSAISSRRYEEAIDKLREAVKADGEFAAAYQQLGDISRKLQKYEDARNYYSKVISINPDFHQITYFGLAESEINSGEYSSALQHLAKYNSFPNLSENSKKQAAKYVADCNFAIEALKHPVSFKPVNLGEGVNSAAMEYLPVITADEETLIFSRQQNNNEDFYKSTRKDEKWVKANNLGPSINSPSSNEASQSISPDGKFLFFTGCNRPDGNHSCDIYLSSKEGKDWSKPFNLGAPVNSPGWETQPSISPDGRTLYFVSTRAGGLGGSDIWKSDLSSEGEWGKPVNLGPSVNTLYNEQSPFIHHDNKTLYFSSDGWPGMGNKDIFMSKKGEDGSWGKPQNLGYPINTFAEESSLIVSSNGKTAYFASNTAGGFGGLDLYSFELPEAVRPGKVTYLKGRVTDIRTKETLDANVRISELKTGEIQFEDQTGEEGAFLATMVAGKSYGLEVEKEGFLFYSGNFSLDKPNSTDKPFQVEVALQRIEAGSFITLHNIFFETKKADLLPESKVELQQLLSFLDINQKVTIEISGHTDNVGEETANQLLSENRAKAVYSYLISNKINPARLIFKGYGESKPIADNATEEGRQKNRRTEFKIVKN